MSSTILQLLLQAAFTVLIQLLYIDVECDYCVAANLASAGNLHTCILHYCEQLG